jgi:hypothetical protein
LFGVAVARAGILPRWTGILLIIGVILNVLLGLSTLPEASQIAGSTIRNIAFVGMGAAALRRQGGSSGSSWIRPIQVLITWPIARGRSVAVDRGEPRLPARVALQD